ncbi:Transglycosylase SLT domain-containing protein [Anaerocolumna xylanovorans DSM 12503]|uniref:Transglycosylase SLT domain-containing protein n=2 Tax=Anaerocolumna TaxID=1843210 RepID=A0A1M7YGT4_9FIRM|nr:Transglycosylase SLT domain-containing protein [Anaerocolumna xylanovorans DSM 12503]
MYILSLYKEKWENFMSEIQGINRLTTTASAAASQEKKVSSSQDFSSFLGETVSLDEIFNEAADKYNVPVNLLKAIGKQESNFKPDAVSRCGAQGIMQLMPRTAASLGVTDSFDPKQNIMGGAKYISQLLDKYDGNASLALAAYNAGSNNVAKYGGIPPFKETQNYVKKVMGYMQEGVSAGSTVTVKSGTDSSTNLPNIAQIKNNLVRTETEDAPENNILEELFSYDDYLKFMEIFMEENKNDKEEDKDSYFSKAISYNAPVMNLFNN